MFAHGVVIDRSIFVFSIDEPFGAIQTSMIMEF